MNLQTGVTQVPSLPLVSTIKERCRVCYTCVRECPAKAIRIEDGQAEVIAEKCIGCGNCVRICSQKAKKVQSARETVVRLLSSGRKVSACIAPSFPAEFVDIDYRTLVGMVRALGFDLVHEVAFGADLVADRYRRMLDAEPSTRHIAVNCPAVVEFICRYYPNLVKYLSPIVSPMLATSRAVKALCGADLKMVFIGPCIAKKAEKDPYRDDHEIDAVLTFIELRELFAEKGIHEANVEPSEFDPPHSRNGSLFPVSRGMLQVAHISDDLLPGKSLAADGRNNFMEAIREFESGALNVKLLEVLCCNGCIMGPGMSSDLPLFSRRAQVIQYAHQRLPMVSPDKWKAHMAGLNDLDLSRGFLPNAQCLPIPTEAEIQKIFNRMGKFSAEDELNCGACGYDTCREHAVAIHRGSAETEMCLPYNIDQLHRALNELAVSNEALAKVQEALVQSEKLASMGQLAAGIAHEINNPLGIVLMYAHLVLAESDKTLQQYDDLKMIVDQTERCKKIVTGLLNFSRQNKVFCKPTHMGHLVDQVVKLMRPPNAICLTVNNRLKDPMATIDADQVTQVLNNLLTNAVEAILGTGTVVLSVHDDSPGQVTLSVADTGSGIPLEFVPKIFDPFFTTKKLGKGTGLGLAVAYGIVKMHRGDITVTSNADPAGGVTGTTFTVTLPRQEDPE